jgi:hypothetical protein
MSTSSLRQRTDGSDIKSTPEEAMSMTFGALAAFTLATSSAPWLYNVHHTRSYHVNQSSSPRLLNV